MIGHGFVGLLQSASYVRPPLRTTGAGPGSVTDTAAGYALSGFADTCFAWLDAPKVDGKWYWEVERGGNYALPGIADDVATGVISGGYTSTNAGLYTLSGMTMWVDGAWTDRSINGGWTLGAAASGDVLGFALDLDSATKTLSIYLNGVLGGVISWTSGPTFLWPMIGFQFGPSCQINLGPAGCVYAPPAGYAYL